MRLFREQMTIICICYLGTLFQQEEPSYIAEYEDWAIAEESEFCVDR
jgi:hypothetical protein